MWKREQMRKSWSILCCVGAGLTSFTTAQAQQANWPPAIWTEPTAPFHIAGPIYYVGGRELSAYLLVDPECNILINVGMEANAGLVRDSITQLGFDPAAIRYVLITQAHFDHAGGANAVSEWNQAQVLAGPADAELLQRGGIQDYVFGDELSFAAVHNARGVSDGEIIQCGAVKVEALATPGHTPGSTSWRLSFADQEREQVALFAASVSVLPNAQLLNNPLYPQVVTDFTMTYQRLEQQQYDYYLPDHLVFVKPKAEGEQIPSAAWFRNHEALPAVIQRSRQQLEQLLSAQQ